MDVDRRRFFARQGDMTGAAFNSNLRSTETRRCLQRPALLHLRATDVNTVNCRPTVQSDGCETGQAELSMDQRRAARRTARAHVVNWMGARWAFSTSRGPTRFAALLSPLSGRRRQASLAARTASTIADKAYLYDERDLAAHVLGFWTYTHPKALIKRRRRSCPAIWRLTRVSKRCPRSLRWITPCGCGALHCASFWTNQDECRIGTRRIPKNYDGGMASPEAQAMLFGLDARRAQAGRRCMPGGPLL